MKRKNQFTNVIKQMHKVLVGYSVETTRTKDEPFVITKYQIDDVPSLIVSLNQLNVWFQNDAPSILTTRCYGVELKIVLSSTIRTKSLATMITVTEPRRRFCDKRKIVTEKIHGARRILDI